MMAITTRSSIRVKPRFFMLTLQNDGKGGVSLANASRLVDTTEAKKGIDQLADRPDGLG